MYDVIFSRLEAARRARGLHIHAASLRDFLGERSEIGLHLLDGKLRSALDETTHRAVSAEVRGGSGADDLARSPVVMGTGYLLGRDMHRTFCPGRPGETESASLCALFNLLLTSIDLIFDDYPRFVPRLLARLNGNTLRAAVALEGHEHARPTFSAVPSDPQLLQVTLQLADSFFARCRRLGRQCGDRGRYTTLCDAMEQSYVAEIESVHLMLGIERNLVQVREILRRKSSLPIWILAFIGSLAGQNANEWEEVQPIAMAVADLLWIIDDIVDLEEDTLNGLWNFVPLRIAETRNQDYGDFLAGLNPWDRIGQLVRDGALDDAVEELFSLYEDILHQLRDKIGTDTPLERNLLTWLYCHTGLYPTLHPNPSQVYGHHPSWSGK